MKAAFLFGLAAISFVVAQEGDQNGAKAMFFNPASGEQVPIQAKNLKTLAPTSRTTTKSQAGALRAATGLQYYFDLRQKDGTMVRVNSNRVFHSGEKIRMHLVSNADGNLAIFQRQEDEPSERLFPSPQMPEATGRILKGTDTTLPSKRSWFVFDQHPGEIHLSIVLEADGAKRPDGSVMNTKSEQLADVQKLIGMERGSKALVIERDDSLTDASEFQVLDRRRDPNLAVSAIAIEVVLSHQG